LKFDIISKADIITINDCKIFKARRFTLCHI